MVIKLHNLYIKSNITLLVNYFYIILDAFSVIVKDRIFLKYSSFFQRVKMLRNLVLHVNDVEVNPTVSIKDGNGMEIATVRHSAGSLVSSQYVMRSRKISLKSNM